VPEVVTMAALVGGALGNIALNVAGARFDAALAGFAAAAKSRIAGSDGALPNNHDVEAAVRLAHIQALRALGARFLQDAPKSEEARDYTTRLNAWLDSQISLTKGVDADWPTTTELISAVDDILANKGAAVRERAEEAAWSELELHTRADAATGAPLSFHALFHGEEGWYRAYGAFLAEAIKTEPRFRDIFLSTKVAEIAHTLDAFVSDGAEHAARLQASIDAAHTLLTSLREDTRALLSGQARQEEQLAQILAFVSRGDAAAEAAAQHEIALLRAEGVVKDRAIETFLRDFGETPLEPRQLPEQLIAFAERYRGLLDSAQRASNLPAIFETDRARAREAIEAGDLGGADAILETLHERLQRWSDEQQQMLDQARRDRANVLAERAKIADARLDYLQAATFHGQAAAALPVGDTEERWAALLAQGCALSTQGRVRLDRTAALAAVGVLEGAALSLASKELRPLDWATTQHELARAYIAAGRLHDAATTMRAVLQVRTKETAPIAWADAHLTLAWALHAIAAREGKEHLPEAAASLRLALDVHTREASPAKWTTVQDRIAWTMDLLRRFGDDSAKAETIAAAQAVLDHVAPDDNPGMRAFAHHRLGAILGDEPSLRRAIDEYRLALSRCSRDERPSEWSALQHDLGKVLYNLGADTGDKALLAEARVALDAAIAARPQDAAPGEWASSQMMLGDLLSHIGASGDSDATRAAMAAYRNALSVHTNEVAPLLAPTIRVSLAYAALDLAKRGDNEMYRQAAAEIDGALALWTNESHPDQWGRAHYNRGWALQKFGEATRSVEVIRESLASYKLSIDWRERDGNIQALAQLHHNIGQCLSWLGNNDPAVTDDELRDALEHLNAAIELRPKADVPVARAFSHLWLGHTWRRLSRGVTPEMLDNARKAYTECLEISPETWGDLWWRIARFNIGLTLLERGRRNDEALVREASEHFNEVLASLDRELQPQQWGDVQQELGRVYIALVHWDLSAMTPAIDALAAALEIRSMGNEKRAWAFTAKLLGLMLETRGDAFEITSDCLAAIGLYRQLIPIYEQTGAATDLTGMQLALARCEARARQLQGGEPDRTSALGTAPTAKRRRRRPRKT